MQKLSSPWLSEKERTRPIKKIETSHTTDVIVVGGGIAGVSTAYEILKQTRKKVTLIDAGLVGGGATGRNAGQFYAALERPFDTLIDEFGAYETVQFLEEFERSWDLLKKIKRHLRLKTQLYPFTIAGGINNQGELIKRLKQEQYRRSLGAPYQVWNVRSDVYKKLKKEYKGLVKSVSLKRIQTALETTSRHYCGYEISHGIAGNSSLFVEEIVATLLRRYPSRFHCYEQSPISSITFSSHAATAHVKEHSLIAQEVVLATNGFENITLGEKTSSLNHLFHHNVRGEVGFMAGYMVDKKYPVRGQYVVDSKNEIASFEEMGTSSQYRDETVLQAPYFYVTHRPYKGKTLVVIGGPGDFLDDTSIYNDGYPFRESAKKALASFARSYRIPLPKEPTFLWHGLMGYTRSGLRVVGVDTKEPRLFYNIGCNGIGLLTSLMGSERIGKLLSGKTLPHHPFDPREVD